MALPQPVDLPPRVEPRDERIAIRPDMQLAVRRWDAPEPAGAPVLLVHGLASNARTWDALAPHLAAAGHTAIAIDQRGHGRSDKPDAGYDLETVSGDLALAIARLGLDRPVVVGQSWGGNVVLELAARRPELVAGIACVDGGTIELSEAFPSWEACAAQLAPPRLAGLPLAELEGHLRAAHRDWDDVAIAGTLASFEVRPDGTIAPRLTFDRHMTILHELWRHRPSERYWSLPVPVLLVPADTGEADWTDRKRAQVELAEERLPQARVRWFSPADHDIQSQRPGELADVLIDAMRDGFFG